MEWLVVAGSVVFFLLIWGGTLTLLAWMGGWTAIAAQYRAAGTPAGRVFRMQSAKFGWVDYNGCLTVRVGEDGLGLALMPPFRPGHPPLFVPWSALHVVIVQEAWWGRTVTVDVGTPALARVRLPLQVMEAAGRLPPGDAGPRE